MKKLSNTEAKLKKSAAYKKNCVRDRLKQVMKNSLTVFYESVYNRFLLKGLQLYRI